MLKKDDVNIGVEWRFRINWPGQKCLASQRRYSGLAGYRIIEEREDDHPF